MIGTKTEGYKNIKTHDWTAHKNYEGKLEVCRILTVLVLCHNFAFCKPFLLFRTVFCTSLMAVFTFSSGELLGTLLALQFCCFVFLLVDTFAALKVASQMPLSRGNILAGRIRT